MNKNKKMRRNKKIWWVPAVLIPAAAAGSILFFGVGKKEGPQEIKTVKVIRMDIGSSVMATGIVKPMVGAEVKVGSRVSGVVKRLRAQIGDLVKAGDIIAELDDAELRARDKLNLASLAKAEADLEYARITLERQKTLLADRIISRQDADLAENACKKALAQVDQAKAEVDLTRVQLGYTRIYASITGVIASISTQEGETVAASFAAPTFVNLIDLKRLEVQTYVDETDIGKIKTGLQAFFTVDTYPDTDFEGRVTAVYPKAVVEDNVVNYIATVEIMDFKDRILRPEMTAAVNIILETRKNILAVPTSLITRERGERFVSVLENGIPVKRKIKIGWKDGAYTEIARGLEEGDLIVVSD